jgi:hypothetical protein
MEFTTTVPHVTIVVAGVFVFAGVASGVEVAAVAVAVGLGDAFAVAGGTALAA